MTTRRRVAAASAALGLLALLMTACATPTGDGSAPAGVPSESGDAADIEAAWLDSGRIIGLVTYGSSSCVPMAADEASVSGNVLTVELVDPEDTACTRDLVPRASLIGVPEGVDPSQDLEVRVTGAYAGEADLDGVAGLDPSGQTDYLPTAGWTDADGQFVILSWGSSSCAPVIESVAASGPAEVTVTFVTPPGNQVCTMDMAPRGVVAVVEGLEEDDDVFAILEGAEFDNIRIPIYGSN